jgi:hypothetical protein
METKNWKIWPMSIIGGGLILLALSFINSCDSRREPISLDVDKIIEFSADKSNWLKSVTGVWGDAVVAQGDKTSGG